MAITQGASNKAYISAIPLLDRREILRAAVDIYNEEGLLDVLQLSGKVVETTMPTYNDFAEDPLYALLDSTGATVTGSGTASVTTAFTAATSGFIRKGEKIVFPNGKVGQVQSFTSGSQDTAVVIKSIDGTNLTHVAGDKLSPIGTTVGERSTAPSNRKYGFTQYSNQVEIFREVNEITDVQNASQTELEWNGSPYIFDHDIAIKFMKFKGDINATFIAGRKSTALFSDASSALLDPINGGNQQSTMGLNQYVTTYGVNATGSGSGTTGALALTDFESFFNLLVAARAPKKHAAYMSSKVFAKVDNCLKALGSASVQSAKLNLDGKTIDFDVKEFTYMGFNIQFTQLPIFDHPVIVSQTDIVKSIFFVPDGKVPTRSNGAQDRIRVRYMKNQQKGLGNDIYAEWDTGALARGGATSDEMVRRTNWVTTQGLQFLGGQHFGKLIVL